MSYQNQQDSDYQFEAQPQATKVKGEQRYRSGTKSRNTMDQDEEALARTGGSSSQQQIKYERLDETPDEYSSVQAAYYYIDRPPTPEYIPLPPGLDKDSQIERYDWDLHDFDVEVEPILEVLVGRTLEQSRIELIEEWEDQEWRKHRRNFEIRRNVELMKTQRMDKEFKRLTEEKERRRLQRDVHYEQKNSTHKKLYGRVMSKSLLKGLGVSSIKFLKDLRVLYQSEEAVMREQMLPWLVDEAVYNLNRKTEIKSGFDKILSTPVSILLDKHGIFLEKDRKRLRDIEYAKHKAETDFQEARKERRERRRLQRLNRDKRNVQTKITNEIMKKQKTDVPDPLAVRIVDFDGGEVADWVLVLPGGLILEMYTMFSVMREKLNERTENKYEDFMKREGMLKYLVNFLAHQNLHPENMTLQFNKSAQEKLEAAVALGEKNLFELNEKQEEIITEIIQTEDLIPHPAWRIILAKEDIYSNELYKDLMFNLVKIYLKSNDYKIPEEEAPPQLQEGVEEKKPEVEGQVGEEKKPEGEVKPEEGGDVPPLDAKKASPLSQRKATEPDDKPKYVIPEITPFDLEMVAAKAKLKINYSQDYNYGKFNALVRVQYGLNRTITRREQARIEWEEANKEEKKRLDGEALVETKRRDDLDKWYEGRNYLYEERRERETTAKEEQDQKDEQEKEKVVMEYIDQFYGHSYPKDLEVYPVNDSETFSISSQKFTSVIPDKRLAFINYINIKCFREKLEEILRQDNKELNQIKDVNFASITTENYREVEQMVYDLSMNKEFPDLSPVFDFEIGNQD